MTDVALLSNFFVLALINREFKREFIQRVLYGSFKLHDVIHRARKWFHNEGAAVELTRSWQQADDLPDSDH